MFTLFGSVFLFAGMLLVYLKCQSVMFVVMNNVELILKDQILILWFFLIGFGVKIPIYPLHLWLPEAHVEAPTVGSVVLAGVSLKVGFLGLLRIQHLLTDAILYNKF